PASAVEVDDGHHRDRLGGDVEAVAREGEHLAAAREADAVGAFLAAGDAGLLDRELDGPAVPAFRAVQSEVLRLLLGEEHVRRLGAGVVVGAGESTRLEVAAVAAD